MGVLNVTPDSFSDGGRYLDPGLAEARALRMEREGAHIIDIGGESTRPGSLAVTVREETRRVLPVIKRLAKRLRIPISIDTWKRDVAVAALDEGAAIVNDVRALSADRRLAKDIARRGAGVVLMHMRGTPETMQRDTTYRRLVPEIVSYLRSAVRRALDAGIARANIAVDPGFGFGKSREQNFELLARLAEFSALKLPLLVGLSRKSFIGAATGRDTDGRLYGSLAAASAAIFGGAHVLRVHDVLAHAEVASVLDRLAPAGGVA